MVSTSIFFTGFADDTAPTGDLTTTDTTLTFTLSAPADQQAIDVYEIASGSATLLGQAVQVDSTTWTFTTSALALGAHSFAASGASLGGFNTSAVGPEDYFTVTVEQFVPAAPVITGFTDDSGATGDGITGNTTPTLTLTADAGATVTILVDGTPVGTATEGDPGTFTFTSASLADGSYTITATATVDAITGDASEPLALTIDATAPGSPVVSGTALTNDTTPTLTITAEAGSTVTLFDGGEAIGTATETGTPGTYTYTFGSPIGGAHSYTATATDAAGNTGAVSAAFAQTIDASAPAAPVISNFRRDTGVTGDHITSERSPTLIVTAEAGSTVRIYNGETLLGSAVESATPGVFSFTSSNLADGTYGFTAVATDGAGNASTVSSSFALTIDSTAPSAPTITDVVQDTGSDNDHVTSDTEPTLVLEAESGSIVTVYQNGVALGQATELAQPGAFIFSIPTTLADGTYTFTAVAADVAGNRGATSADFAVTIDTATPATPLVTAFADDTGGATDRITSDATPTLTIAAEPGSTVQVSINGQPAGFAVESEEAGVFTYTAATLEDGSYTATVVATDAAGNASAPSAELAFSIDTVVPAAPVIVGFGTDSGTADDGLTNDTSPTLTITAEPGARVEVFIDGTSAGFAVEQEEHGQFAFTAADLADGSYSFTATATDGAGNASPASEALTIAIDATAPDAPAIGSVAGGTIAITAESGLLVTVYRDGEAVGTATEGDEGSYTFTDEGYGSGVTYTAIATDAAGNASAAAPAITANHAPEVVLGDPDAPYALLRIDENYPVLGRAGASDADHDHVSYSIAGGDDANLFAIDETTGILTVVAPLDFENPADANGDGVYLLTVAVSDGEFTGTRDVVVVVDDVAEETVFGTDGEDQLIAGNGNSALYGGAGNDLLLAGAGNDILDGGEGADTMVGGGGNDTYYVDHVDDQVLEVVPFFFGPVLDSGGYDTVVSSIDFDLDAVGRNVGIAEVALPTSDLFNIGRFLEALTLTGSEDLFGAGNALANRIEGNAGANVLLGRGGNDTMFGGDGNDQVFGNAGNDRIDGGAGDDRLVGGGGRDVLTGGAGIDTLIGGSGADVFVFADGDTGSTRATADVIRGFEDSIDTIDLSAIDADTVTAGDQGFTFIGDERFSGIAGELRAVGAGSSTLLMADTNGDGTADLFIRLTGEQVLDESNFVL